MTSWTVTTVFSSIVNVEFSRMFKVPLITMVDPLENTTFDPCCISKSPSNIMVVSGGKTMEVLAGTSKSSNSSVLKKC